MSLKYFGVSLPEKALKKIDTIRADVPRSRYILRMIEKLESPDQK
jgi:metal-responsive CopG/Arc/MetJ family transcriptional regulator